MNQKSFTQLRFLCYGAGAIGTYIGGSLALAGQKVVFLERPEVASSLRIKGLKLHRNNQTQTIQEPDIVSSIEDALTHGPFDVAIFAVKSYDTRSVIDSLLPYSIALPPFLCLQNGVDNEKIIAEALGQSKVIPASVTTAIGRPGPGEIAVEKLRGIGIASEHALAPTLVAVFNDAGLKASLYPSSLSMRWSKMLTNLLANASSAILDMTSTEIFQHPGLFKLEVLQIREALRVMDGLKIPVTDLPGTPVVPLMWVIRYLPPSISRLFLVQALGKGRGAKMPSFHIDLHNGNTRSEVGYLNGAVVKYGKELGIATPVNQLLNDTLTALVNKEIDLDEYSHQPEKLLSQLK